MPIDGPEAEVLDESEIEELWLNVAVERDEGLESGTARAVPADDVFAAAKARLQ